MKTFNALELDYKEKQVQFYNRLKASGLKAPTRLEKLAFRNGWDSVQEMLRPLVLALVAIPFLVVMIILLMGL